MSAYVAAGYWTAGYAVGDAVAAVVARSFVEAPRLGDFLLWECEYNLSRDSGVLASGQHLTPGTVLGVIASGTAGAVTFSGSGNGTCTKDATAPVLAGAKVGTYLVRCARAIANDGLFEIIDPTGQQIGATTVGPTFAREIKFALADGSSDFAVGDTFAFPVLAVGGKYTQHNPAATDGSQLAAAVLIADCDATTADARCAVIARNAIVKTGGLAWRSDITAQQKLNAVAYLMARRQIRALASV